MLVFNVLKRLYMLLPKAFKVDGALVVFLLLVNSILEVIGLGAIIPIVSVVLSKDALTTGWLSKVFLFTQLTENAFIYLICAILLVVITAKSALSLWISYFQSKFSYRLQNYFSQNLFRSFYARGLLYIKNRNSTVILRNINSVPTSFATGVILPLLSFLTELFVITFILIGLILYEPMVVILLLVIVVPTFGLFYRFSKNKIKFYQEQLHILSPELSRVAFEAIYGFTDVKTTGTEDYFFQKHQRIQENMLLHYVRSATFKNAPQKVVEFSMFLGVVIIIVFGVLKYGGDRSQLIALLGVFALAAYRILPSVNRFMMAVMSIRSFEYTIDVMEADEAQEYTVLDASQNSVVDFKDLRLEGVGFQYNQDARVLNQVNLSINKGDIIGIIGESGSGKSTLMNIMLGFYPVTEGQIFLNGLSINHATIKDWHKLIGYVSQDVFMMDASIAENIAFGVSPEKIDVNRVWECLRLAKMDGFVTNLEGQLSFVVGERGGRLSGGQRQRVGIARALYSGAQVLLFDEATASLDQETEREITEAIQGLTHLNLTIIIIAHRLTTLRYCSRVIHLQQGKIEREYDAITFKKDFLNVE